MAGPGSRTTRLLVAFGGWTLLVWGTRIDNILGQDDLTSGGRASRLALALSFTLLGAGLLAVAWRFRRRPLTGPAVLLIAVGAAWTTGVWVVRGVAIAAGDHAGAFIAVHSVLAVVSIALAAVTVHATTMPLRHGTTGHRRTEADLAS